MNMNTDKIYQFRKIIMSTKIKLEIGVLKQSNFNRTIGFQTPLMVMFVQCLKLHHYCASRPANFF